MVAGRWGNGPTLMSRTGFHDVVFDDDLLTARRADGEIVRFTRRERVLLGVLAAQPGRLFSRGELYEALGARGSDRNVDFVINRLRTKLQDTTPERRFISTQYGEGYVWIAPVAEEADGGRFLAIGPVLGLSDDLAETVLAPLRAALAQRLAPEVVLAPELDGAEAERFGFSIDVVFHSALKGSHAAFVLRQGGGRGIVAAFRETFEAGASEAAIDAVASGVAEAIWRRLALGSQGPAEPKDPPLHLRMHNASEVLDRPGAAWAVNRAQFARLRADQPSDPRLGLMWAMNEYGRVTVDPGAEPLRRETLSALNDEVERLALGSLAAVRDDPILTLAAAELLLGVNRGHEDLAESLASTALAGSTAFAAAFPLLGQINAFRGRLDEACRLYDEGLRLCEAGSVFEVYIQIMKSQALIAMEDRAAVEAVFQRVVTIKPEARRQVGLFFLPPDDAGLARSLAPLVDGADLAQARRVIAYLHYRVAANFGLPGHVANVMRGPLTHLGRRFGPSVASDEIWREMPEELHYLRGWSGPRPGAD